MSLLLTVSPLTAARCKRRLGVPSESRRLGKGRPGNSTKPVGRKSRERPSYGAGLMFSESVGRLYKRCSPGQAQEHAACPLRQEMGCKGYVQQGQWYFDQ